MYAKHGVEKASWIIRPSIEDDIDYGVIWDTTLMRKIGGKYRGLGERNDWQDSMWKLSSCIVVCDKLAEAAPEARLKRKWPMSTDPRDMDIWCGTRPDQQFPLSATQHLKV
jgi:hypothetical protein